MCNLGNQLITRSRREQEAGEKRKREQKGEGGEQEGAGEKEWNINRRNTVGNAKQENEKWGERKAGGKRSREHEAEE